MWSHALLFTLQILTIPPSVFSQRSVTAELHQAATLPCDWKCSGLVKWTRIHLPGHVLAQCDQTSCRSEKGFNISHDQYLEGKPYLTIAAADYTARGIYTCQCEGSDVCDVRLFIKAVEVTRVVTPGEPIDVLLPLSDMVEVRFSASDALHPSPLQICTVVNERMECSPEYRERVSRINTLQIKDGNASDSGNYTVRDSENDETITVIQVHVGAKKTDDETSPPVKGEHVYSSWTVGLVFCVGLVTGVLLRQFVWPWILTGWSCVKKQGPKSPECDHRPLGKDHNRPLGKDPDPPETTLLKSV
ncbi:uncharacterized protein LOC132872706 isoform X2 [Neoarius graeffei]|nr:uncharacterized protein LOC132872706 isoform X2 [Neoarius graeffei]XP_060763686.1 uncharacterized protein LOC132872706 isoform X2 [Neoarius graeffei]XP_060763687.1 uncharacterized protein LOC132872706 isoform X2 [Neoarius graeffei]XP_060763688.1 uncharacterized protein LOC132872706 isoform X2 [Neoarius graeffei]XP_060763689.1 uncharacterized protein LOC132872706 isoform X2 [Neoarius graeffei]